MAEREIPRMDVHLFDVDRVGTEEGCNRCFGDRHCDLIALVDDDLLTAPGCIVLEVVVATRNLTRSSERGQRYGEEEAERQQGNDASHPPYTTSAAKNVAARRATIPNVASATSATAFSPVSSSEDFVLRQK